MEIVPIEPLAPENLARRIVGVLRSSGHQAWFAGGCVRDLLLEKPPKDYDIATDAVPERLIELFPNSDRVGAHFGVVLVRVGGAQVEVATFRTDHAYEDGRRPASVQFESDPRQDVMRRDFTINAMLLDPESGKLLDYVGGRDDLQAGLIRAIGDPEVRFREDHLRLLRAIRFAARLGFEIEQGTFAAIQRLAASIRSVSAERVRDELVRILTEGGARQGLELLDSSGLLREILPEVAAMKGVEQPPEFHPEGDVWTHTLIMMDELRNPSAALALGVLLHDVGKPSTFRIAGRIRFDRHVEAGVKLTREILSRLRFSQREIARVESLVANHMRFKDVPQMRESTLKRFLRLPDFDEHLELHRLDCLSSHGKLSNYEMARAKRDQMPAEVLKPAPLLTGDDLIAAGYRPGPQFSKMLAVVEDAQLESRIHTREEALELVRERWQ